MILVIKIYQNNVQKHYLIVINRAYNLRYIIACPLFYYFTRVNEILFSGLFLLTSVITVGFNLESDST